MLKAFKVVDHEGIKVVNEEEFELVNSMFYYFIIYMTTSNS